MYLFLSLILAASPVQIERTAHCDLIELNHYYDDNGEKLLDQLIFYDWCPLECRYQVRQWNLTREVLDGGPFQSGDGWTVRMKQGVVTAKAYMETWRQSDPELAERKHLPQDQRVPLFGVKSVRDVCE